MSKPKRPLDRRDYSQDPRSRELSVATPDGCYVYVMDGDYRIYVVPDDAPHLHPKVLGHARPARYAGEVVLHVGRVVELTNCSGTFQFENRRGLLEVARAIERMGLEVAPDAVIFHYYSRVSRPKVLPFTPRNSADE